MSWMASYSNYLTFFTWPKCGRAEVRIYFSGFCLWTSRQKNFFFSTGSLWWQSTVVGPGSNSPAQMNTWMWSRAIYQPTFLLQSAPCELGKVTVFVVRLCIPASNCAWRTMGQADTYEIFPLLSLATASAAAINPPSAEHRSTAHTLTHTHKTSWRPLETKQQRQLCFLTVIITASFDLFQPHLVMCQQQRRRMNVGWVAGFKQQSYSQFRKHNWLRA